MDHAVRVHQEISEAKPIRRRGRIIAATAVCAPLLAFSVYSMVARPEFIWGSRSVLPPDQADANARVALFMLAQRIEGVRAQRGAYPASLAEIGEGTSTVQYRLLADSLFELRLRMDAAQEVVLLSNQDLRVFLGDSPQRIQGREP